MAPEEPIETISAPVPEVTIAPEPAPAPTIAPRPPVEPYLSEPYPEHCLERGPSPSSLVAPSARGADCSVLQADGEEDPYEVRRQLREELEAEEAERQEKEMNLPPLVPRPSDHTRQEHSHIERAARVSGIFNRRAPVEFDETKEDYFGLPRLARQPPKVTSKPHEPRSYAKLSMNAMEPYRLQSKKS